MLTPLYTTANCILCRKQLQPRRERYQPEGDQGQAITSYHIAGGVAWNIIRFLCV